MLNLSDSEIVLILNCGSSSIKFGLFDIANNQIERDPIFKGKIEGITGIDPHFSEQNESSYHVKLDPSAPYRNALIMILYRVKAFLGERSLRAIGHRVVHGGPKYFSPVIVDNDILQDLRTYIPLAPIHQPFALEAIEILLDIEPTTPQVACFDTGFHQTLPLVEQIMPLPYWAFERGIRRYGFHGISYEYLTLSIFDRYGEQAKEKIILAHLGSGASLCALNDSKSVATSMGFSALEGLMMGTRTGAIDPGAVLHLMEIEKLSLEEVIHILYHESGLLGVSGISSEPRKIVEYEDDLGETGHRARLALDLYIRRIVHEIGSLVAVLGGLDMLVFSAGVGENNPFIRQRVCESLTYLGLEVDPISNESNSHIISTHASRVKICVEPTNEEWMMSKHIKKLIH